MNEKYLPNSAPDAPTLKGRSDPKSSLSSGKWGPRVLLFLGITFVGLLFTLQGYFGSLNEAEDPITFMEALIWQLSWWYIWLLLTPVILKLVKRYPMELRNRLRNWRIHVPGAMIFSVLHAILLMVVLWIISPEFRETFEFPNTVVRHAMLEGNLQLGIAFYAILVGIASAYSFYHLYQEEELKKTQLEAQLMQTRFDALKMQLYPEFLFGTMNSISELMKQDVDSADTMLARVGDFLRLSMENLGTQEVPLQSEMAFLKSYLEIERIRRHNRLEFRTDIDPDAYRAHVPNLILQPLVETAIRNSSPEERLEIRLQAKRLNGTLQVEILNRTSQDSSKEAVSSPALALTRLKSLYGDSFQFEHGKDENGHYSVRLVIPYST